jgi:hypothetical protein
MMDQFPKSPEATPEAPPEALLRAIAQDLAPVRPSPRPLHLALRMVPLALIVSSLILLAIGPRGDSGILGPLLTWGASAAQFLFGCCSGHFINLLDKSDRTAAWLATTACFATAT